MMRVFSRHRFPIWTIAVFIRVFANILATALTVAFRRPPWSQPYDGRHQVAPTNQEVLLIRGGNGTERMAPRRESSAARSRFFPFSPPGLALAAPPDEGGRGICRR